MDDIVVSCQQQVVEHRHVDFWVTKGLMATRDELLPLLSGARCTAVIASTPQNN